MNPILIILIVIVLIFLLSKDGFYEVIKTLFFAMIIALSIRSFAYEPFSIPSGSMKPTLLVGDFLFVSKFSYGFSRYSVPFGRYFPIKGRVFFKQPKRGDVAVFKFPRDNKTDYIKRIIGLPGDIVRVSEGIIFINDKPVPRTKVGLFEDYHRDGYLERYDKYKEQISNEREYFILDDIDFAGTFLQQMDNSSLHFDVNNTKNYTVPAGHYFAMGDNREHSSDSRILKRVGFIPEENLVGRAEMLFFSIQFTNESIVIFGKSFFKIPAKIRLERIGNLLWVLKK